ncbi:MAG: enoyl-CoA hydratase/isomerase family protein [Deltaproteobacteria bacterium]|jgi:enoyl-CoA hydratase/carnithine racemase|nr:enoyl-CoA hydratase/isomerase family protein [Deltaproteobacteria bacterium]MBT6612090.1 enoyl-CoA hydratase/isomerase family protein [Deltaproteobacteria bacterium]
MEYKNLLVERTGNIAVVSLNRPEKHNALSVDLLNEIDTVAKEFNEDAQTRVVIFTGKGKNFSVGADLTDPKKAAQADDTLLLKFRHMKIGPRMVRSVYEMDQITIAAVNGFALGGAACLASACDFRIGAETCHIGYPEVNLAMNLSWAALPLCVHLVGPARAKRMVILANRENAVTLEKWGFLDEVVPVAQLLDRVREIAAAYAAQPPLAAQMVKRSINAISSALDQAIMHMDSDQFLYATSGEDFQEAIQAFFEKRSGVFKGN